MRKLTGSKWGATLCLVGALLLAAACGDLDKQDSLSRKERAWLEDHGPIKVASDQTYHPFAFGGAGGRAEGICVDLWKAMAKKLGFEVRFTVLDDPAQVAGLHNGALDSTTGLFPITERRAFLDFSEPFYPVTSAIFINQDAKHVRDLDDLRSVPVGVVTGDSAAVLLAKNSINMVFYDTYRNCVLALGQGQVPAAVMDDPVMLYWRKRLNLLDRISWAPDNAVVERNDLALPVKKGNQVLLSIINKGLALLSSADIQRIRGRYIR